MHPQSRLLRFPAHVLLVLNLVSGLLAAEPPGLPADGAVPVKSLDELADTSGAIPATPRSDSAPPRAAASGGSADTTAADTALAPTRSPSAASVRSGEKGLILSAETGKPVPHALVILMGEAERYSRESDADGLYQFADVQAGAYRLKVGKRGFAVYERESQSFAPGGNPVREIRLERSVPKGQLIEAKGGSGAGSSAALLAARRKSSGVMEGVGAEQIAKGTDADAGAVARRITGTSLVGGKYIYVRGLGERYTNMTLNGLPVPSPEKDKRVVPQDLFPAWALESFAIRKTFTPESYADFAGGSVALETKGIPEKDFLKISLGGSGIEYRGDGQFLNFGRDRLTYDGGNTYFGFDDGTRNLPDGFPRTILQVDDSAEIRKYKEQGFGAYTKQERLGLALRLTDKYAIDTARIRPNQNYSIALGQVHNPGGEAKAGYIISAAFKNRYSQRDIHKRVTVTEAATYDSSFIHPILKQPITFHVQVFDTLPGYTGAGDREHVVALKKLSVGQEAEIHQGIYEGVLSGLADFGFENGDHRLYWKNFAVNVGTDEATWGHWKQLPGGRQDNPYEDRYLLEFNQRSLIASQAGGGHYIGKGPLDSLTWAGAYYHTSGNTPDSRRYYYIGPTDSVPLHIYQNNDIWGTRIYEKLEENSWAGRVDGMLVTPPEWTRSDTLLREGRFLSDLRLPSGQTGLFANARSRGFSASRYQYGASQLQEENQTLEQIRSPQRLRQVMSGPGKYDFYTAPKSYDEYKAGERAAGGYASAGFGFSLFHLPLGFDVGARLEDYHLRLEAPFTGQQYGIDPKIRSDSTKVIDQGRFTVYPMAGISLDPTRNTKLRFIYTRTELHPEFREIAPYSYADYVQDRFVTGNPDLRPTKVRNLDLRWDWYLPNRQILSFSLFRKDFTDPVEPVADNNHTQKFQNAKAGYVRGAEVEAMFDLEAAGRMAGLGGLLTGWTAGGNVALMHSQVRLDTGLTAEGISKTLDVTSLHRPMVGQSPYLVNLQLGEEGERRRFSWNQGLAYNVFGPRIKTVGIEEVPDEYEQPFHSLDYLGRVTLLKRHQVTLKVKNLLASRKRTLTSEYNDSKEYYTVPQATLDRLYQGVRRDYAVESAQEGTSYELGYSIEF